MDEATGRAKRYWRYKYILRFLDLIVLISFLILVQFTNLSARLKDLAIYLNSNFYLALLVYIALLSIIYYIVALPLDFCDGFALEHAFSLSNLSLKNWLKDHIKKGIISFLIFAASIELFLMVARNFYANWWMIAAVLWTALSVILAKIFPLVIIPIFYEYKALTNAELKDKILGLAKRLDMKVLDIFEIDFSKKTKKSNAAIVGWGDTRRIILADNLVNEFSPEEVEVVVAHEMAHYKLKHMWKLIAVSGLSTALSFYILSLVLEDLAYSLGAKDPFDIAIFPAICLLFVIYGAVTAPIFNGVSRRLERAADELALKTTQLKTPFISLMEKLAAKNLSDKDPNRIIEILFYDHPPISKRIKLAKRIFY